jgi:hypothetical protein
MTLGNFTLGNFTLLIVFFLLIIQCIFGRSIYFTIRPDAPVHYQSDKNSHISAYLGLGELVVGHEVGEFIEIVGPLGGFVARHFLDNNSENHVCHSVFKTKSMGDRAFYAGNNTLGSCSRATKSSWIDQWPVGNGGIGALVGGSLYSELVPLSTSDYYVVSRKGIHKRFDEEFINSENESGKNSQYKAYKSMRASLLQGHHDEALKASNDIKSKGAEGRYEFLGDLIIAFSGDKLKSSSSSNNNDQGRRKVTQGPRDLQIQSLQKELEKLKEATSMGFKPVPQPEDNDIEHSISHLNMENGVASTTHVQLINENKLYTHTLHHRSWLSTSSGVLMGSMHCHSSNNDGCLGLAFKLDRSARRWEGPLIKAVVEQLGRHKLRSDVDSLDVVYKLGFNLGPTERELAPHAYVAVAIVCSGSGPQSSSSSSSSSSSHNKKNKFRTHITESNIVICHGGHSAWVFISVEKEDSLNALKVAKKTYQMKSNGRKENSASASGYDKNLLQKLKKNAWEKLDKILSFGITGGGAEIQKILEQKTKNWFQSRMKKQYLQIGPPPLFSQKPSTVNLSVVSTLSILYQYGRYLLLSGGNKHVMNLQGIWADGISSMWNGDYHLNINLQMSYWPIEIADLSISTSNDQNESSSLILPYIDFMKKLRKNGEITAKQLYHANSNGGGGGWVAHGYTDGYMDTGILGDVHWAYCVSCGAWASLALLEHVTFAPLKSSSNQIALIELLQSFKGTSKFFLNYFTKIDSSGYKDIDGNQINVVEYHTGPSGSPETSYGIKINSTYTKFNVLSMSPAIDMSILKNIAIGYSSVVGYVSSLNENHKDKDIDIDIDGLSLSISPAELSIHQTISKEFNLAITKLPLGGNPIINSDGRIAEFPNPYGISNNKNNNYAVADENIDLSHRHWSGMHWLYPGTFHPKIFSSSSNFGKQESESTTLKLYQAALSTMKAKTDAGGGHTGWSACWQSLLWSRLNKANEAWEALVKVIDMYTTPRLMGLHPELVAIKNKILKKCETCFHEKNSKNVRASSDGRYKKGRANPGTKKREMVTEDGSLFQIDTNFGILSSIQEMLLQTHIPGVITLLPAVPNQWGWGNGNSPGDASYTNIAKGFRGRGDILIDMVWDYKSVEKNTVLSTAHLLSARITFGSKHFYHSIQAEVEVDENGNDINGNSTFSSNASNRNPSIFVKVGPDGDSYNNQKDDLQVFIDTDNNTNKCALVERKNHSIVLHPQLYPCIVIICKKKNTREKCKNALEL